MVNAIHGSMIREAVAVFDDAKSLEAAIDELESSGFDRAEISLLAGARAVEEKLGHVYLKVDELEDDPSVPRTAYVSRESIGDAEGALIGGLLYVGAVVAAGAVVASGGALATAIGAAALAGGSGAAFGALLSRFVGESHANDIEDQLDHGGLVLWVRTTDKKTEERAKLILTRHAARDIHIHDIAITE